MSAPDNIPADVIEAAREHIAQGEMAIVTVVNAIMAERERCAKIARDHAVALRKNYDHACARAVECVVTEINFAVLSQAQLNGEEKP
jgi:hypothetical protein